MLGVRYSSRTNAADGLGVCLLEGEHCGVGTYEGRRADAADELHRGRVRLIIIETRDVRRSRGTSKGFRDQWAINRRAQAQEVRRSIYQHNFPTPQPSIGQYP